MRRGTWISPEQRLMLRYLLRPDVLYRNRMGSLSLAEIGREFEVTRQQAYNLIKALVTKGFIDGTDTRQPTGKADHAAFGIGRKELPTLDHKEEDLTWKTRRSSDSLA